MIINPGLANWKTLVLGCVAR